MGATPSEDAGLENEGSNARTGYARFQQRLGAGADCQELFEIRNEVRRPDQSYAGRMTEDLRAIGCYSSASSRTPVVSETPDAAPEDDLAEQLSSYRRRAQALQAVYGERIPRELEQLLLAGASLDAEEYSYRWAVYSTTLDEVIRSIASLVDEARELQRSARRAGEGNLVLEMESGITAMETGLLGLREQRAEAEGMYQQMQDMLRQP